MRPEAANREKMSKGKSQPSPARKAEANAAVDEQPRTAKLFMHGRSQAVRLPKEFRFPGKEVRVRRLGGGVLIEPVEFDVKAWFERLDSYGDVPFLAEGIDEPPPVSPEKIFDE
jgi:antitoxin VapB